MRLATNQKILSHRDRNDIALSNSTQSKLLRSLNFNPPEKNGGLVNAISDRQSLNSSFVGSLNDYFEANGASHLCESLALRRKLGNSFMLDL